MHSSTDLQRYALDQQTRKVTPTLSISTKLAQLGWFGFRLESSMSPIAFARYRNSISSSF